MSDPSFITIPDPVPRIRLDRWLATEFPQYSRSEIQNGIKTGFISSPDSELRPGTLVRPGLRIKCFIPEKAGEFTLQAEELPLEILYEDQDLVALNKHPGQVVHPSPGHPNGTILNAMLFHYPELNEMADTLRPGLVHRLDSGTSGVLLFARNQKALCRVQESFKRRQVGKTYHALCHGIPAPYAQRLEFPIGRHPVHRQKRAVNGTAARPAISSFTLLRGIAGGTGGLLEVNIETGRTHQIRVHLAYAGHPVLGDTVYGGKKANLSSPWPKAERVMLHAKTLEISHPAHGERFRIEAPYSNDMVTYLNQL